VIIALSSNAQQVADAPLNAVEEIVERIKTLKAAHSLEAAPERTAPRSPATVEEAITTRIRQREQAETAPQPEDTPAHPATPPQAHPEPWTPPQQLRLF